MSFLYPLGLLGLIGIPVLIIIYIIKNKYTEQTVSSTYLWTLSQKFLKRKNPISRLTGIIALVLQILTVLIVSLCIARPTFFMKDMAKEYCFILDASGSMNMQTEGESRLDRAKAEIQTVIDGSVNGSVYSLIYVGDTTKVVFERTNDKKQATLLLESVEPAHVCVEYVDALGIAQGYFDENGGASVYLVTDKEYTEHKNVEVIQVAKSEENFAVGDLSYTLLNGKLTVSGQVVSYASDRSLTVNLFVDGTQKATLTQEVAAGMETPFTLSCETESFSALRVAVEGEDSLAADNEYIVYDITSESTYNTLLVSDAPFFTQSVVEALINAKVDVVASADYTAASGYGLYIFDTYTPEVLPKDGAVWFINPVGSVEESGFTVKETVELEKADKVAVSTSSSSATKALKADLLGDELYISGYAKCGTYRNFTTLYSYQGNPVVFAGTNTYGNREVVLAFDIRKSNLPLLYDYIVMTRNFIEFSFPTVVEKTDRYCGEIVDINVLSGCTSIRVDTPLGNTTYLDTTSATSSLKLTEVGVYTLTMTVGDTQRSFHLYSALPKEERATRVVEEEFSLQGEKSGGGFDGIYDPLKWLFVALALLFLADWGVYCYEKHQLR